MADRNIAALREKVAFRVRVESSDSDGRRRPMIIYPAVEFDSQVAGMVAHMQQEIDYLSVDKARLERALEDAGRALSASELTEKQTVAYATKILKSATATYAKESTERVKAQRKGVVKLESVIAKNKFDCAVPSLLRLFVNVLSHWSDDSAAEVELELDQVSDKCLLAGILTSWAHHKVQECKPFGHLLQGGWAQARCHGHVGKKPQDCGYRPASVASVYKIEGLALKRKKDFVAEK